MTVARSLPTYNSEESGARYHVTVRVGEETIDFQKPLEDPFARTTVHVGRRDLLRGLRRGSLKVEVLIGADPQMVADVIALDERFADRRLRALGAALRELLAEREPDDEPNERTRAAVRRLDEVVERF